MRALIEGMSFRRRLARPGTAAVALAILLALGTAFLVMRSGCAARSTTRSSGWPATGAPT